MAKPESNEQEKSAGNLNDALLEAITGGMDGPTAEMMGNITTNIGLAEEGTFELEDGYTVEEVAANFKAAYRGLKFKKGAGNP